jgi:D-alanyl-D-alanine carboxypeptidase/D-alanyl-D-alanine-endopeptidase (penicillin-binding protein 4)
MNRESVNHYAELLFRNAARGTDTAGSAEAGNAMLRRFASERLGVDSADVYAADGSGLSVLDRVTPRAMVHLLDYAHKASWGSAFHASLPVAGESELLRRRMRSTPAQGNLHAKTGTTNNIISLAGYVTALDGEVLAFTFIYNGNDRWRAKETIDQMGATLANFVRE